MINKSNDYLVNVKPLFDNLINNPLPFNLLDIDVADFFTVLTQPVSHNNMKTHNKISEQRVKELLGIPLWNESQIAEYLNMTVYSVRNMACRGEIPGLKRINGKKWYVHVETFVNWFKESSKPNKPKKRIDKGRRL